MISKLVLTLLLVGLAGFMPAVGPPLPPLPAAVEAREPGKPPQPQVDRIEHDLKQAIARVQPVLNRYGYPAVFLTIMVEGVGILAPGQTFLIAAALTAAQGHLKIVWVLILAFLAAVLGNSLGYLIGRWGGRRLLAKFKVKGDRLARLEGFFRRYGGGVVVVARFFEGLRQLNGIIAGMLVMPWGVFTAFNVLGAILWTGVWGLGAYFLDKEIDVVHFAFRRIELWVVALTLAGFMALMIYLFRHRQTDKPK